MKKISLLALILILATYISCERDDICAESTSTTPRLIIDLYDNDDPDSKEFVFDLVVIGIGNDEVLDDYSIVDTDVIYLPLKTDDNTTQYSLIEGYSYDDNDTPDDTTDDIIGGNEDIITINYSREEVYVSRACGYKTVFKNVTITVEDDGDNWIESQQPLNSNQSVEDETTTHFNIFL